MGKGQCNKKCICNDGVSTPAPTPAPTQSVSAQTPTPAPTPAPTQSVSASTPTPAPTGCQDDPDWSVTKPGKKAGKTCTWIGKDPDERCKSKYKGTSGGSTTTVKAKDA